MLQVSVIREADNRTIRRMRGLPHARVATCHYHGRVRTHGDAHAAISDCGARLMGVIALHDDASTARHLVLQTVPERLRIRKMREPDMHHLVYKSQPAPVKMRRKRQQDGDPSTRSTAWSHNITVSHYRSGSSELAFPDLMGGTLRIWSARNSWSYTDPLYGSNGYDFSNPERGFRMNGPTFRKPTGGAFRIQ